MSIRSKQRKARNVNRYKLARMYWSRYSAWANREPSRWRIFAWLKWRREQPYMPKWLDEYEELLDKYWHY